ncbi:lysophospholipid acyltransferase family protein [Thiobacter aerophilum]|uniref:Lysophospholipid acyltransferase family protein n=1 Tax=Thiobacter aerophilum TaxID=3121275 RepID=A0ABV0EEE4_9BURK
MDEKTPATGAEALPNRATTQGGIARLLIKLVLLAFHLAWGAVLAALVFPFATQARREAIIERWAQALLGRLSVRVTVTGVLAVRKGAVFVANHISWLDVWLLDSQRACRFVAKAEVARWPLIGWLAKKTGTLFIRREQRHHTAAINREIAAALADGACIALFPESTTSDGLRLRRFHPSLLQPAVDLGAPVIPVAIRYVDAAGNPDTTPAYIDQMTLLDSLTRIIKAETVHAELAFLPAISTRGRNRREIARAAQAAIAAALSLPDPDRTPETAPGLPSA